MNTGSRGVPQGEQIHVDVDPAAALSAYAQHRRRFAAEVSALNADQLAAPSRCHLWSVADVLRHGRDVDEWMQALWSGGRPPFMSFDPTVTPHEFVLAGRVISDAEARDRFVASSGTMATEVEGSGAERWASTSVSPVGFVPWWLSALHVFFDSWIHERDVLLPLGITPPVEPSEALPVLAYSFAIVGTLITDPTDVVMAGIRVRAGSPPARATPVSDQADGAAGDVIDALLGRGSVEAALVGTDPDVAQRFGTLARIFSPV